MSELKIVAKIVVKQKYQEELQQAMQTIVKESRKEQGNISYDLHQDTKKPATFIFIEAWKSQEAINSHNKSNHFQEFVKNIEGKFESLEIDIIKQI